MIIDTFLFFGGNENEFRLLELRIKELEGIVDEFVAVESTHTHAGKPKPMYLGERYHTIDYTNKLTVLQFDAEPYAHNRWYHEALQREAIRYRLQTCEDTDVILLSDLDEIPSQRAVEEYLSENRTGVWAFEQDLTYLYMNTFAGHWNGTKAFTGKFYHMLPDKGFQLTQTVRYRPQQDVAGVIHKGGWHFSSCGGLDAVRTKFDSYLHTEMQAKSNAEIEKALKQARDPFHNNPLEVRGTEELPEYVKQNLDKYREYIYTPPKRKKKAVA